MIEKIVMTSLILSLVFLTLCKALSSRTAGDVFGILFLLSSSICVVSLIITIWSY